MRCSAGHENRHGARYCESCGLALGVSNPPRQGVQPLPPPTLPSPYPSTPGTYAGPVAPAPGFMPPATYGSPQPLLARPRNGMGTAGLVLGILGLFFGCLLGGLAIIFGAIGVGRANRLEATNKGSAIAGLVLGVIGFILWTVVALASLN